MKIGFVKSAKSWLAKQLQARGTREWVAAIALVWAAFGVAGNAGISAYNALYVRPHNREIVTENKQIRQRNAATGTNTAGKEPLREIPGVGDLSTPMGQIYWTIFATLACSMAYAVYEYCENAAAASKFQFIPGQSDVYLRMLSSVGSARKSIRTTHLRNTPLHAVGREALEFQNAVHHWLVQDPTRELTRVVSLKPAMVQHAIGMIAVSEMEQNYQVIGLDWKLDTPAVNLAIIDDRELFICFYDRKEHLDHNHASVSAIFSTDADCIRKWISYFDSLTKEPSALHYREGSEDSPLLEHFAGIYRTLDGNTKSGIWKHIDACMESISSPTRTASVGQEVRTGFPRPA